MALLQEVEIAWGGELRRFKLTVGGLRAVQAKADAGPEEIAARLLPAVTALNAKLGFLDAAMRGLVGRYRLDDVREPILQGLIGGGLDHLSASALVVQYVDDIDQHPLRANVPVAFAIIMAAVGGVPDEPTGERKGEATTGPASPEVSSGSATSTEPGRVRASRRRKSTG